MLKDKNETPKKRINFTCTVPQARRSHPKLHPKTVTKLHISSSAMNNISSAQRTTTQLPRAILGCLHYISLHSTTALRRLCSVKRCPDRASFPLPKRTAITLLRRTLSTHTCKHANPLEGMRVLIWII